MGLPPVVALEIGTSKTLAVVGEMREDGNVMITGMGEYPSLGVRKSEIVDLQEAAHCVQAVLQAAEETAHVSIRCVHLVLSGGNVQSMVGSGTAPVIASDGEIGPEDTAAVEEVAKAVHLPPEREIIHTIRQYFAIDETHRVVKPDGMHGARLTLNVLLVHARRNLLRNTGKVVHSLRLDVEDCVFAGLASALAVLTPEQKKSGAIVIDLGGGTTNYAAYADGYVAAAGAIGVGGDHVTNDIALAFNIPVLEEAERIKREHGSAVIESPVGSQRVALPPPEVGLPGRSISARSLQAVVNARMDETLMLVRKAMESQGILHHVVSGVVLTGGGAKMRGVTKLAERIFNMPCAVGRPRNVAGLATATEGPEYAACVGMVQHAFRTMTENPRQGLLGRIFGGFFGR